MMSVIKVKNESGEFVDIPVIQGAKGDTGQNGTDGVSVTNITTATSSQSNGYTVTPITFEKSNSQNVTLNIQAKNGADGQDGADGTSINVIQAADEDTAISLSQSNPNNVYYWSE